MWVRSLSLLLPHPLVLTGKGRSFLQPKLPTLPLRPFLLSLCVLYVPHTTQTARVFAAFHSRFPWWLVAFSFVSLVLCSFLGGVGVSTQYYFLYRYCLLACFFSAVIRMVLCISNLGYGHTHVSHCTVYTLTGFHSFCMKFPLT